MPPKPIKAERLAGELEAFGAQPAAGAHGAVHARQAFRGGEQQPHRAFGDGGVAIALDDVHADAEAPERFRVHVAARAGAEEDHVAQPGTLARDLERQGGVVDDRDLGAAQRLRQFLGADVGASEADVEPRVGRIVELAGDAFERRRGIDEDGSHALIPVVRG
jgi:hypothetical protein